jgi:hypothetical protein
MRQVMPHRNNIGDRIQPCKGFLPPIRGVQSKALPTGPRLRPNVVADTEIQIVKTATYIVNDLSKGRAAAERGDG